MIFTSLAFVLLTELEENKEKNKMRKVISVLSTVFFLATFCTIALADAVPGAVLYLDARDNPADPDAWTNLGTAGGELSGLDNPPEPDDGTIEIPSLNIKVPNSSFYTHEESGQCWGADGDAIELFLADFTIEFLLRLNGPALGEEHHLAGFQANPREADNCMRINFWGGEGQLGGEFSGVNPPPIMLEEGKWSWVTIVNDAGKEFLGYQNGERVWEQGGVPFDDSATIDMVIIGANSYGERARTFNGSIALVRIYDIALDEDQVMKNINAWSAGDAVEPASKLTTTWGTVKTEY